MPRPPHITVDQSDAIENGIAVLHACIEAAIFLLQKDEPQVAFGLTNARRDFEDALKAIWGEG